MPAEVHGTHSGEVFLVKTVFKMDTYTGRTYMFLFAEGKPTFVEILDKSVANVDDLLGPRPTSTVR